MEVTHQPHEPAALPHWVGPRATLDILMNRDIS